MRISEISENFLLYETIDGNDVYVVEEFSLKRLAQAGVLASSIAVSPLTAAKSDMQIINISTKSQGYASRDQAAIAFYQVHNNEYNQTSSNQELVGYLLYDQTNKTWHFTDSITAPATFTLRIGIRKPKDWITQDIVHTHPAVNDGTNQDGFSKSDVKVVTSGNAPGYYVRAPNGNIRYINKAIARSTGTKWGAEGKLITQTDSHIRHQ